MIQEAGEAETTHLPPYYLTLPYRLKKRISEKLLDRCGALDLQGKKNVPVFRSGPKVWSLYLDRLDEELEELLLLLFLPLLRLLDLEELELLEELGKVAGLGWVTIEKQQSEPR